MLDKRASLALLALIGTLAATGRPSPAPAQIPDLPNFVVIVADDQRADTLGAMPKTTRWFGSQGRLFTNGFVTTPLCCPSRASIFTGRYAHNHGVQDNRGSDVVDPETMVQSDLKSFGYQTALFGKYLNKWKADPPSFDRWAVPRTKSYLEGTWNVDGSRTEVGTYSTRFLEQTAVTFLSDAEAVDVRPWLMFVTPQAAHRPYTPEAAYADARVPDWAPDPSIDERNVRDKPRYIRRMDRIKMKKAVKTRERQWRTLMSVDDMVDAIFTRLSDLGELENTYVFYLSDNGFAWGDHRLLSAGALKNTPYNSSVKVPFLMYGPELAPGSDDRLVANIDIAPTILDLAGIALPRDPPMDGRSLMRAEERDWLLLVWWKARDKGSIPPWRSLRSHNVQYTEYVRDGEVVGREFYDLVADNYQLENILGDGDPSNDPDLGPLHDQLEAYFSCSGSSCP